MAQDYEIQDPGPIRRPRTNWAALLLDLSENHPDTWVILARDVNSSIATHLRATYGVEAVVRERRGSRAGRLHVMFVTGQSTIGEEGERIRERRDRAREARKRAAAAAAKIKEKK